MGQLTVWSNVFTFFLHRELHMTLHPGWSAKDNYAINAKRKKKKRERNADGGMTGHQMNV